ncbi:MAG TPA: polymer-forming cytoskeletal protein [Pyrinomonadaceae bacterium]|nr:polymer-forming cytoskeletal protein [Pyrinomonadaceae bacterium]
MGRGSKPEPTENDRHAAQQHASVPPQTNYRTNHNPPAQTPHAADPVARAAATPTATKAVTEAESLAREIKDGTMSGFVGGGTVLTGEVVFKGMLRVDGHLSGSVRSEKGTLIVSSGGLVDADTEVAVARVNGTVNGDIVASERLELGRTARVNGHIQTPALAIEQGAIFEGVCRMPQRAVALTARAQATTAVAEAAPAQGATPNVESRSASPNGVAASGEAGSKTDEGGPTLDARGLGVSPASQRRPATADAAVARERAG